MSRQSLTKAHAKISELTWEPTFATPATRFGTDYTFEKAPKKDPLKQIMRSYFPMEEEKDNRLLRIRSRTRLRTRYETQTFVSSLSHHFVATSKLA